MWPSLTHTTSPSLSLALSASYTGQVFTFSSMHVSGEQLDQYTGVAATLRFPLLHPEGVEGQMQGGGDSDSSSDDSSSDDDSSDDDLVLEEEVGGSGKSNGSGSAVVQRQYAVSDLRRRLSSADETELEGFDIDLDGFI